MTPRSLAGAALLAACCALAGGEAGAHVISDKEVLVLRALPPTLVAGLRAASLPDSATGLCGANRGGWQAIGAQRGALLLLASAASRSDSAGAEQAWRSLDAVFRRQGPDGRIGAAPEVGVAGGDTMAMVDWAGEACRALIAVTNGPLRKRFQFRYSLLLPKLEKLVRALEPGAEARAREHARDAAGLLADAQLFLLADGIYHDAAFGAAGQRAIAAARTLQRADGAFLVHGRAASPAQQALCLQRLQSITQYFPAPSLESALARGATRLGRTAVRERRRITGDERREVALALALVGERGGDAEVRAAAAAMLENRR